MGGTVVSIDVANDWYLAIFTLVHSYPSPNNAGVPWNAGFASCCRIPQVNAPGPFSVFSTVDLALPDSSPVATIFPIVPMQVDAVNNIFVPLADAEGDTLTCRFATPAESGMGG